MTSAQLRAARAYLGWTMEKAAMACGLHRRTIIRLENDEHYAQGQPASLRKLVALYRERRIILEDRCRGGNTTNSGNTTNNNCTDH